MTNKKNWNNFSLIHKPRETSIHIENKTWWTLIGLVASSFIRLRTIYRQAISCKNGNLCGSRSGNFVPEVVDSKVVSTRVQIAYNKTINWLRRNFKSFLFVYVFKAHASCFSLPGLEFPARKAVHLEEKIFAQFFNHGNFSTCTYLFGRYTNAACFLSERT